MYAAAADMRARMGSEEVAALGEDRLAAFLKDSSAKVNAVIGRRYRLPIIEPWRDDVAYRERRVVTNRGSTFIAYRERGRVDYYWFHDDSYFIPPYTQDVTGPGTGSDWANYWKRTASTQPEALVSAQCEIARYMLYDDKIPEVVQSRFDNAMEMLQDLAMGKSVLSIDGIEMEGADLVYSGATERGDNRTDDAYGSDYSYRLRG